MNIKYLGPSDMVIVHPHGEHRKDEIKEYTEKFGKELIATSKKQHFSIVESNSKDLDAEKKPTGTKSNMTKPGTKPGAMKRPT